MRRCLGLLELARTLTLPQNFCGSVETAGTTLREVFQQHSHSWTQIYFRSTESVCENGGDDKLGLKGRERSVGTLYCSSQAVLALVFVDLRRQSDHGQSFGTLLDGMDAVWRPVDKAMNLSRCLNCRGDEKTHRPHPVEVVEMVRLGLGWTKQSELYLNSFQVMSVAFCNENSRYGCHLSLFLLRLSWPSTG